MIHNKTCYVLLFSGEDMFELLNNCVHSIRISNAEIPIRVYVPAISDRLIGLSKSYNLSLIERDFFEKSAIKKDAYSEYGTKEFNIITSNKWKIIIDALDSGYQNVIFTDCDVSIIRDCSNYVEQVADAYPCGVQSESQPTFPPDLCTGFMFFSREAYGLLESVNEINLASNVDRNDQDIFNLLVKSNPGLVKNIWVLPEALFQNGLHAPFHLGRKFDLQLGELSPFVFHANYVKGLKNKIKLLQRIGQWHLDAF
jgi:hypothetical protein